MGYSTFLYFLSEVVLYFVQFSGLLLSVFLMYLNHLKTCSTLNTNPNQFKQLQIYVGSPIHQYKEHRIPRSQFCLCSGLISRYIYDNNDQCLHIYARFYIEVRRSILFTINYTNLGIIVLNITSIIPCLLHQCGSQQHCFCCFFSCHLKKSDNKHQLQIPLLLPFDSHQHKTISRVDVQESSSRNLLLP